MPIFTGLFSSGEAPGNLRSQATRPSQGSQTPPGHQELFLGDNLTTTLPSRSDRASPVATPFQFPAGSARAGTEQKQQAPSPQQLNYEYNPDGSRRRSFLYPRLAIGMGIERLSPPKNGGYFRSVDRITADGGGAFERVMLPSFELFVRRADGQIDENTSQPYGNSQAALRRLPAQDSNPLHQELLEVKQIAAELYELACKQWFPCPYQGCQCRFRSCDDQRIQTHFQEAHTAIRCNFCSLAFLENTPVKDRLLHLATEHSDLFGTDLVDAGLYKTGRRSSSGSGSGSSSSQQPKDAMGSGSPSRQYSPGQRQSVLGIPSDFGQKAEQIGEQILKFDPRGRSLAKRPRRAQDPTYRPPAYAEETEEEEEEEEEVEDRQNKRRRKSPGREPAVQQPARPARPDYSRSHSRRASGRHTASRASDPSYYPRRNGSLDDYSDDMDDELRRSAVWEWTQDVRDPTGRRKRLFREPGTKGRKAYDGAGIAHGAGALQWANEVVIAPQGKGKETALQTMPASGESKTLRAASASGVRQKATYPTAQKARAKTKGTAAQPGSLRRSQRLQRQ